MRWKEDERNINLLKTVVCNNPFNYNWLFDTELRIRYNIKTGRPTNQPTK